MRCWLLSLPCWWCCWHKLCECLREITRATWTQTKVESSTELMMLTVEVLKAYCGEMELSKGGTNEQIAERLRKARIERHQLVGCFVEDIYSDTDS